MSATTTIRERHRITHTPVFKDEREFNLTFTTDGVKCKEKFQRDERTLKYPDLLSMILGEPTVKKEKCGRSNPNLKNRQSIELDMAAEDLKVLAVLFENGDLDKKALLDAKEQALKALNIIRAKLTLI